MKIAWQEASFLLSDLMKATGSRLFAFILRLRWNNRAAPVAQLVEHVLGKDEVSGSIPLVGSRILRMTGLAGQSGTE